MSGLFDARAEPAPAFRVEQSDAIAGLEGIKAGIVSAVVTDPPYCSGGLSETGRQRAKAQGVRAGGEQAENWFSGDNMGAGGLRHLIRLLAVQSQRVLVEGGSLVVFCDWRMAPALSPAIESAGLLARGLIVWDKGSMGLGIGFRPRHELALHFSNGKLESYARDVSNVIRAQRVPSGSRKHPCEKPVGLLREIVRVVSPPGGLIVDPFAGSGSTGEAAQLEGREFLGFDRDGRWSNA